MSLRAKIRDLREAVGLTQKELAQLLRVAQNTMSSWENNDLKAKKLYQFGKLCQALNCEHTAFLARDKYSKHDTSIGTDISQIGVIRKQITTPVRFSSPIAHLRSKKSGLSQEKLAEVVGVSPNTIQNWENENNGAERHSMIARLCELLNCTYRDLVTDTDDAFRAPITDADDALLEIQSPNEFIKNQCGDITKSPLIELAQECDDEK